MVVNLDFPISPILIFPELYSLILILLNKFLFVLLLLLFDSVCLPRTLIFEYFEVSFNSILFTKLLLMLS